MSNSRSKSDERLTDRATDWLQGLFERMDLDANVEIDETDSNIHVNIVGPGADAFITQGLTPSGLNALRAVLQQVLFPNQRPFKKLSLDAGGHRERRSEQLEGFAAWLSEKATDLDKNITVVGINSVDRRAVHLALEGDRKVKTESEGFGPFRRLKITTT
ncbi:MAG: hypothetical protein CMH57_03515 [Myxococcales bacterium]|nr:hypothetical protein [Myxococcales bacterium]